MYAFLGLLFVGAVLIVLFRVVGRMSRSSAENGARDSANGPQSGVATTHVPRAGASQNAAAKSSESPLQFWVPPGQPVDVAGRRIEGGLIYVGSGLASPGYGHEVEPALINPRLKVGDPRTCDPQGIDYWPSYSGLTPSCRAVYLDWLAGGRRNPATDISFVFIYFYGLERRTIVDAQVSPVPEDELTAIRTEVQELLAVYGKNQSFSAYAQGFLECMTVTHGGGHLYQARPPVTGKSMVLPPLIRLALAQLSRDGVPVPPEWAFAWAWHDPQNYLRTPAERCRDEMFRLFEIRYRQKYGEGMILKPCKRTVTYEYRAASRSVARVLLPATTSLPDVASLTGPIGKLRDLFDECSNDLDAYSRWIGRHPNSVGSIQAAALLPVELAAVAETGTEASQLRAHLARVLSESRLAVVESAAIMKFWPPAKNGNYARSDALALAQFLDKLGYSLEPDVRFGGPRLDATTRAVVFAAGSGAPVAPSGEYLSAVLTLRLASAVAVSDGVVTDAERQLLRERIDANAGLSPAEIMRLQAHLEWLLAEQPGLAGIKRKLEGIEVAARELLGQFLLSIAAADGSIAPEEIKAVAKLYSHLGLDPDSIYSDLHKLALAPEDAATGPVTVRSQDQPKGFAIQPPGADGSGSRPAGRVVLDPRLVEAKRREAERAALLLSSIFREDEPEVAVTPPEPEAAGSIAGLDAAHSTLLALLAERTSWSLAEVEQLAAERGLMTEGALETINEAAWDKIDEAVLDVDDQVTINQAAWEAMRT